MHYAYVTMNDKQAAKNLIDASDVIDSIENRKLGDSGLFGTFYD